MGQPLYTRRRLLRGTLTLGASLGLLVTAARPGFAFWPRRAPRETPPADASLTRVPAASPRPSLALSLAVLQAEAASAQQARQPLPVELAQLGGLNRLDGFMAEPDGEVVLLGEHEASLPPLHLDDLVVSLRHAYHASPAYEGTLGCTIDPWQGAKDPWQIQQVRVFGMPPSVLMAQRHVAIDYELKRISAGLVSLGHDVPSLYDLNRSPEPLCGDTAQPEQRTEMTHRFWFYPRYPEPPRFLVEGRTVLILKPVEVQLLTEQEFRDQTGQRTGAAAPAPPPCTLPGW